MIASLRQLFYPREFRIKDSGIHCEDFQLEKLIEVFEKLIGSIHETSASKMDENFIKGIATSVWRLQKRIEQLSGNFEASRITRALNMINDVLKEHNIEIKDYSGKIWGPPYSDDIWDSDVQGCPRGIIMMRKPRIKWDGNLLQRGDIIVNEGGKSEN